MWLMFFPNLFGTAQDLIEHNCVAIMSDIRHFNIEVLQLTSLRQKPEPLNAADDDD